MTFVVKLVAALVVGLIAYVISDFVFTIIVGLFDSPPKSADTLVTLLSLAVGLYAGWLTYHNVP